MEELRVLVRHDHGLLEQLFGVLQPGDGVPAHVGVLQVDVALDGGRQVPARVSGGG